MRAEPESPPVPSQDKSPSDQRKPQHRTHRTTAIYLGGRHQNSTAGLVTTAQAQWSWPFRSESTPAPSERPPPRQPQPGRLHTPSPSEGRITDRPSAATAARTHGRLVTSSLPRPHGTHRDAELFNPEERELDPGWPSTVSTAYVHARSIAAAGWRTALQRLGTFKLSQKCRLRQNARTIQTAKTITGRIVQQQGQTPAASETELPTPYQAARRTPGNRAVLLRSPTLVGPPNTSRLSATGPAGGHLGHNQGRTQHQPAPL